LTGKIGWRQTEDVFINSRGRLLFSGKFTRNAGEEGKPCRCLLRTAGAGLPFFKKFTGNVGAKKPYRYLLEGGARPLFPKNLQEKRGAGSLVDAYSE